MATLQVKQPDAYKAFEKKDILQVVQLGTTPSGMPNLSPNVTVETSDAGRRVTVRWFFEVSVIASDEDEIDDVEKLLTTLVAAAGAAGTSATGGAIPSDPAQIIKQAMNTVRSVADIWKATRLFAKLAVRNLRVTIVDRLGAKLSLRSRVQVDASWMANDPTENGSYAWIELEKHEIRSIVDHKGQLPADLDDLTVQDGITPWQPANDDDLVGAFKSDLHLCTQIVDRDELDVTVDVSCNAISDDDVVAIVIRSLTLELELLPAEAPPVETVPHH